MFWLVSMLVGLALVFAKLGALSVWLSVFKIIIIVMTGLLGFGLVGFIYKYFFSSKES